MPFTTAAIDFLSQLELNNDRDWFQPRKQEFDASVRGAMVRFVERLNAEFANSGRDYVTDPQKSIYRIYRRRREPASANSHRRRSRPPAAASTWCWDRTSISPRNF